MKLKGRVDEGATWNTQLTYITIRPGHAIVTLVTLVTISYDPVSTGNSIARYHHSQSPRHPSDRTTTSTTDSPALFSLSPPSDNRDDHTEWRVDLSLTYVNGGNFGASNAADLPCELQHGNCME